MGISRSGITQQQLRQELEVFGERMTLLIHSAERGLVEHLNALKGRISNLEHRMDGVEQKVDHLNGKVGVLEEKVSALDNRVGALDNYVRNGLSENLSEILGKLTADV